MVSFIIEKWEEINTSLKYYQKKRGTNFFEEKNISLKNHISQSCLSISRKWKEIVLYPSTIKGKQLFLRKEKLFFLPTIINEEVKFFSKRV